MFFFLIVKRLLANYLHATLLLIRNLGVHLTGSMEKVIDFCIQKITMANLVDVLIFHFVLNWIVSNWFHKKSWLMRLHFSWSCLEANSFDLDLKRGTKASSRKFANWKPFLGLIDRMFLYKHRRIKFKLLSIWVYPKPMWHLTLVLYLWCNYA